MHRTISRVLTIVAIATAYARASDFKLISSSFLGGSGDDDRIVGGRIQSDGTIVLAANLAEDVKLDATRLGAGGNGCIVRLSSDGRKVLGAARIAAQLFDLAIDDADGIYIAAGKQGVLKLTPAADRILWTGAVQGSCDRIDAARDGHCIALVSGQSPPQILILNPEGRQIGKASGRGYTNDVCIDSATKTAIFVGFRNARAHDGKRVEPVQIAYIQALNFDGSPKWTDYDWSADQNSDRFINRPTNNMADTRGYRCTIGRDGKLYVGFEAAGGNHIFRYSPTDIMQKASIVGGDGNHSFHASAAEHKTIVCRYEPQTGQFLLGQQWCGRRSNGRANAARMKDGDITADEQGHVYLSGVVGENIPVDPDPLSAGASRSGAYLLILSPDMKTRLLCTRTAAGKGSSHCVDGRILNGKLIAAYAGSGMQEGMYTLDPVQKDPIGKDAFWAVVGQ